MHMTQSRKAASAVLATCALVAATAVPIFASSAQADEGASDVPTSAEVVSQVSYYGDYEGNETVEGWSKAMDKTATTTSAKLHAALGKMNERGDVSWESCRPAVAEIKGDISHAMRLSDYDSIDKKISALENDVANKIKTRDEEIEEERLAAEAAAAAEAEAQAAAEAAAYYDYGYDSGYSGGGYAPTGGLTPQSGVNYYGDQRETYYSSNQLYHYQTSQWTLDDEGFYREGDYYVVAANDGQYQNGDTYEGSKGTCIVRDSGCAYGTTDYYVAW